jgi:multidrug efflux pump subunit AcrA (membrane-fusion protein)
VIPVPDRDVPYIEPGQPAILTFDALENAVYKTAGNNKVVVSRLAHAEDVQTRLMRVEVDVQNPDGKLQVGMYGSATIELNKGAPGAMHIPSSALAGRANGGNGTVRVVRDGKIQTVQIKYGSDDGINVEILSGLSPREQVVTGTNVPVVDGTSVTIKPAVKAGE